MVRQYIIFRLEDEDFAASIDQILSITDFSELSIVPEGPSYIEGLLNLRGDVIPIVNLKKKFNLKVTKESGRIIISKKNDQLIGFLVDDASRSMSKEGKDVLEPPVVVSTKQMQYIKNVAIHEERLILIIDLHNVLEDSEVSHIEKLG